MKNYSSIENWLKSKPNSTEIQKVLAIINRKAIAESKVLYYQKERELKKLQKFLETSEKLGLPVSEEAIKRIADLGATVSNEFEQIWPNGKMKFNRKPKPEKKEEQPYQTKE